MRILPDNNLSVYTIRACQPDSIVVFGGPTGHQNGHSELPNTSFTDPPLPIQTIEHSLIITPDILISNWPVQTVETLSTEHIKQIVVLAPEIILLGTGKQLQWPNMKLLSEVSNNGIGIDVMTTAAACRTYNILTYEGRNVAAALMIN
ncbi:MAG: hypothetical protein GXP14_01260 [Gammaproteobacteria bacterium]|nr:hypothetical protein [Gammaproteobacteria bacterium]